VSRRLLVLSALACVAAAACTSLPKAEVEIGTGVGFVPQSADFIDDVGLGSAVAVGPEGVPYVSYFGFPAVVKKGEIPVQRPVGAPFLPGVLVTSVTDGIWNRGAAAMVKDPPPGAQVAFGPQTLPSLDSLTAAAANGTDIAVDGAGGLHVVWAGNDGVWYASGGGTSFAAEQVFELDIPLSRAGPLGWPSVAAEGSVPWVAFTTDIGVGQQVVVATKGADGWIVEEAAVTDLCPGCAQPKRTEITITPDGPLVAYVDNAEGAVMAARRSDDGTWTTERIEGGVSGDGLSLALAPDGSVWAAYYAGDGTVHAASSSGAQQEWRVVAAGEAGDTLPGETTGIAADADGIVYVAFVDAVVDAVVLVAGDGSSFEPVPTRETEGGRFPAVAVTEDGAAVYLSWYDTREQDLLLGTYGDVSGTVFAEPSSMPTPTLGPVQAECEPDGTELEVTALNTAFDTRCLAVPAAKGFTIRFVNQDPVAQTGQHNVAIYEDATFAQALFRGELISGPAEETYEVGGIDAGTYFFRCDVHPTQMTGTFISAEAAKASE
jgi:plastocyanin